MNAITWISDSSNLVTQAIKDPLTDHPEIQTQLPITKQVTIDDAVDVDKLLDCDPLRPGQLSGPSVFESCYPFLRPSNSSILISLTINYPRNISDLLNRNKPHQYSLYQRKMAESE
jgi:hypothetical protein